MYDQILNNQISHWFQVTTKLESLELKNFLMFDQILHNQILATDKSQGNVLQIQKVWKFWQINLFTSDQ
jgi:hypothetical protein